MKKSFSRLFLLYFAIAVAVVWTWQSLRPHYAAPQPAVDVWMLNVGQGESVLVREPSGKKLLFDGGPDDSVLNELGSVLPPWDKTLDLVILSHPHADHIKGLISVLERYSVKEVWTSGTTYNSADFREWQQELSVHHLTPKTEFFPDRLAFGEVNLSVYHPVQNMEGQQPSETHDGTLSVKVSFHSEDVFLTGDLNEQHEDDMIAACQLPACTLEAEVLQVPHHGSATGLSPRFLAAVAPKVALIPVGLNNKFNHPRQNILDELANAHIPTYRTDLNGRLHVVLNPSSFTVSAESGTLSP